MPSFKKRVHSQRIPQHERAAVTPYEGTYDEKYSSDEDNVEYDVYEPEDLTERSNSTVTFSEDIYDSDAIEEILKHQTRTPSQEASVRSEDRDDRRPSKSILKDVKRIKKDSVDVQPLQKTVSLEKIAEGGAMTPEKKPGTDKQEEKGENASEKLQNITDALTKKEPESKGEKETITKSLQSTSPSHIDKITDSSATNIAKISEENLEKIAPAQKLEPLSSNIINFQKQSIEEIPNKLTDSPNKTDFIKTKESPNDIQSPLANVSLKSQVSESPEIIINQKDKTQPKMSNITENLPPDSVKHLDNKVDNDVLKSELSKETQADSVLISTAKPKSNENVTIVDKQDVQCEEKKLTLPTREDYENTAIALIDDITKAAQEAVPEFLSQKIEEGSSKTSAPDFSTSSEQNLTPLDASPLSVIPSSTPTDTQSNTHLNNKQIINDLKSVSKPESDLTNINKLENLKQVKEEPQGSLDLNNSESANQSKQEKFELDSKSFKLENIKKTDPIEDKTKVANGVAKVIEKESAKHDNVIPNLEVVSDSHKKDTKTDSKALESEIKTTEVPELEKFKITDAERKPHLPTFDISSAPSSKEGSEERESKDNFVDMPEIDKKETTEKPRVIFRIDSEDEIHSDIDLEVLRSGPTSPPGEFTEKIREELKENFVKDQIQLEERLTSLRGGIFDISGESLSKTKELVDERLRKISEIKPPQDLEEPPKKEKPPAQSALKIGRFHITPALVEGVLNMTQEKEIVEKLKTATENQTGHEEVEKELPEKLTEADLEEVIRELKKEGLKTDIYLQPEEPEKDEKKERTLKRVERRFERMASETLEKDLEEGISEDKINEKREIEFQRMVSNLSSDEVAEYQQEYSQLWDEGGLSSLTPTEDWESRDPDTPENELDDDTTKKPESFRGSQRTGISGEPIKTHEPKKGLKSPTTPPKPLKISDDISPKAQPLTPVFPSHVGTSPSEIDLSSGFGSEQSDDIPTYGERKKFWEQMSSSQSSETPSELPRSMVESVSSVDSVEVKEVEEKMSVKSVKQKFEKEITEKTISTEKIGFVKSLTESYSEKIAAGELVMPAIPRPKSDVVKDNYVYETDTHKLPDSSDTAVVSELELTLKLKDSSAPVTDQTVTTGSTIIDSTKETKAEPDYKKDSKTDFTIKHSVKNITSDNTVFEEDLSLPLSERIKVFEDPKTPSFRKSAQDRSMSLPTSELPNSIRAKKKYFEDEIQKEIIVEHIMTQGEEKFLEEKKKLTPEIEEAATNAVTELFSKGVKIVEETLKNKEKTMTQESDKTISKLSADSDTHEEKNETEENEKIGLKPRKSKKIEEESIPSITITTSKKPLETASVGESEDTQSESDVTPEEARAVDVQWDGNGIQSEALSPKDEVNYLKDVTEPGIGRWIGQEDLSKQVWEKDELDSSHYKMSTKWERTRSEGASPKEPYVCTPEEHYPDTVWEVPVQEQLETEEITHDIPLEKQVIIEKDEEEYEEEEGKTKLTEEEAREIAEEILEYIEYEVENRSSFLLNEGDESPEVMSQAQVTDYIRHLTGGKDFDEQDIQLIESILAKKQKSQVWKSRSVDTTGCSVDITDEDLKSTGAENDISPVESQIAKLKNLEEDFAEEAPEKIIKTQEKTSISSSEKTLSEAEIVDQTIAEVKESLEAAQEQLIEQHKKKMKTEILKKESPSEFEFKGMNYDIKLKDVIAEQPTLSEKDAEIKDENLLLQSSSNESHEKILTTENDEVEVLKKQTLSAAQVTEKMAEDYLMEQSSSKHTPNSDKLQSGSDIKFDRQLYEDFINEERKLSEKDILTNIPGELEKHIQKKIDSDKTTVMKDEFLESDSTLQRVDHDKVEKTTAEEEVLMEKIVQDNKVEDKKSKQIEDTDKTSALTSKSISESFNKESDKEGFSPIDVITDKGYKNLEVSVPETIVRKIGDTIFSHEESPKSISLEDSMKSPPGGDDLLSSASSVDKPIDKSDVVFRHSTSAHSKAHRRSGADLEPYSSSGESHYHSLEQSRPCSSDVEGLLAGNICTTGSSEYESAISHEISSKQPTLTDYQTAVSSLSSRESIKSLDSESSGHLASVEVSSEASETLIPSASDLDKDIDASGAVLLYDDGLETGLDKVKPPPAYKSQMSAPETVNKPTEEDLDFISETEVASWTGGVSEDEEGVLGTGEEAVLSEELAQKMKRSHEMTFQPEPKPIVYSESSDSTLKDDKVTVSTEELSAVPDDKFGSSLEETGSVLSMSLSTSETSAMKTVIELSHTEFEKMDASLTVSATSIDSATRDELDPTLSSQSFTNEMSTSTPGSGINKKTESVTITTSSSDVHGASCVSTQVTSVSRKSSMVDESKSDSDLRKSVDLSQANGPTQVDYVEDYDEIETTKTKKVQGHRRKESTSNFVPTMMWNLSEARTQKVKSDITETEDDYDKYVFDLTLTEKEVKNDEKKEADDLENFNQSFEGSEKKALEEEDAEELNDQNRPHSQISKTDSDSGRRPVSSIFSEDQPDSELSELMKQGSSETEREDPLERPMSPEPEEMENKDITPEFSSEAQASVTELEMEYSGACSRRDEYASHVSPIREERFDPSFKETFEGEEVENVPEGLHSQTSLESTIAEKHELETGEKDILKSNSANDVPNITVTEHMTPVSQEKFQYPETNEDLRDKIPTSKTADTPASSRTSSSSTDGKEYNLDEIVIKKLPKEMLNEEKDVNETKDEKESLDSPSSDSFEMLDKPDILDEFVIIEEVGKEAQENDPEGKSIEITSKKKKPPKKIKEDPELDTSPPAPATKMTDLKYYPTEEDSYLFSFDSDSPPQPTTRKFAEKLKRKSSKEEKDEIDFEQQLEQNKKWLETQFQGEQAAKIIGVYGYEMEFERAPLEDIKEEDINELDSSSKIGSIGSQKESLGSFGSVKDSFSSTPDYDVLTGKKYFTKSGDHDDVSMSSLQEFELIEKKLMENGKKSGSSSSQDSLSSKKLGTSSKSGQGDDISTASLREFETLEHACATEVNMEKKAKQEEAILTEIDEGHESQISESESCETVSAVMKEKMELDNEDFDKKMFEIDEIIRQAQSNVEKFSEMQALEKIESIGRGDSYEEVAKVPDLELDMPLVRKSSDSSLKSTKSYTSYSTQVVTKKKVEEWRAAEKEHKLLKPESELLENGSKIKSISADSLALQTTEDKISEMNEETVSLDSYKTQKINGQGYSGIPHKCDSLEEISRHHESSSGDYTSSGTDNISRPPRRADFMLGSNDSLDPSSSTATHATYQYETDSVMSSSFTSGDSNTLVSSTDNLDLLASGHTVIDLGLSRTDDWLENLEVGGSNPLDKNFGNPHSHQTKTEIQKISFSGSDAEKFLQDYLNKVSENEIVEMEEIDELGKVHVKKVLKKTVVVQKNQSDKFKTEPSEGKEGFITEIVEPLQDEMYSHVVHRTTQMTPEIQKIVFKGPDAEKALKDYIEKLNKEEEEQETEIDEDGNLHVKKILRQKIVITSDGTPHQQLEIQKTLPSKLDESFKVENISTQNKQPQPHEITQLGPQIQRVVFKGPDAEKALEEYTKNLDSENDVTEVEEIDEHGNVRVKKILKQHIIVRPNKDLTDDDLKEYLHQLSKTEGYSHVTETDIPADIQKVTFKGPDAERQLEEFLQRQQPEVEEIEEVDEHGNVHIKKILKERLVIRPSRQLTKAELEQYLNQLEEPPFSEEEKTSQVQSSHSNVQKITFTGPDAEKQLEEFIKQQQKQPPEIEEIEEVDEFGNVHIKKVIKQRVIMKTDGDSTKKRLEQYLQSTDKLKTDETLKGDYYETAIPEVQKITFKGPDAEAQLQEFIQQQQPEIEEIEETDEHGNVHIKRIIKQRVIIRSGELEPTTFSAKPSSSRMLTKDELQQYLDNLEEPEESDTKTSEVEAEQLLTEEEFQQRILQRFGQSQELSERLLTEEEFQERLKQRQSKLTTVQAENIYIGSNEPFVSEIIEPLDEAGFSHIIHRKVQMAPEVQKVVFRGPNADQALKAYIEALNPGEDLEEVEEVDEDGNVHVKKILRRKIVLKPEDLEKTGLTGEELKSYLKQFEYEYFEEGEDPQVPNIDPNFSTNKLLTEGFSSTVVLTDKKGRAEEEKAELELSSAIKKESGISQRPPLVSDISMDDEAEYDTTEHDWRHQLEILHAEADEEEIEQKLDAALAASSQKEK